MRASRSQGAFGHARRVAVAALVAMSLGLMTLVIGQGLSTIALVRAVEEIALGAIVVALLAGAVAFVAVHLAGWRDPESEDDFEELVRHSEELAREGLAVEPEEAEFMELDPLDDGDFEELVRDALDDLPDLLRNALAHVAVVISDGGRARGAYGLYQGDGTIGRERSRPHSDLQGHDQARLRTRSRPPARSGHQDRAPRARPTMWASTSWAYHASIYSLPVPDQGEPHMPEAVIVDAVRTPIGRAVKGSLKSVRADDLAAIPLKAIVERNPQVEQTSIGT